MLIYNFAGICFVMCSLLYCDAWKAYSASMKCVCSDWQNSALDIIKRNSSGHSLHWTFDWNIVIYSIDGNKLYSIHWDKEMGSFFIHSLFHSLFVVRYGYFSWSFYFYFMLTCNLSGLQMIICGNLKLKKVRNFLLIKAALPKELFGKLRSFDHKTSHVRPPVTVIL